MIFLKRPANGAILFAFVFFHLFSTGCSNNPQVSDAAVPSFCPAGYTLDLAAASGGNIPPRAYYQDLEASAGQGLDITLLACDPDNPETAAGMTWSVLSGPFAGTLSARSGTYSTEPYQTTYYPDSEGTDSFYFVCLDAEGEISNVAEIRVHVTLPSLTGQNLYFGGRDGFGTFQLWYVDSSGVLSAVPGSVQALSTVAAESIRRFYTGLAHGDEIFFIGTPSESTYLLSFEPMEGVFRDHPQIEDPAELIEFGPLLYATGRAAGTSTSYLWEFDGAWTPFPLTAGVYPHELAVFGSKLYFAGDTGGGNVQLMSYDAAEGILDVGETAIGSGLGPNDLTACNGKLYFNGTFGTAVQYEYLWSIDDVSPAATVTSNVTSPGNMICFDNELYFTARGAPGSTMVTQLWSVNSSDVVTRWTNNVIADFMSPSSDTYPVIEGSMLYLRGTDDAYTNWLWAHDGSGPLTTVTGSANLYPFYTAVYHGRLYFRGYDTMTGYDQLISYDPVSDTITPETAAAMGFYAQGFVVYTP
jgi:hypothetical protein